MGDFIIDPKRGVQSNFSKILIGIILFVVGIVLSIIVFKVTAIPSDYIKVDAKIQNLNQSVQYVDDEYGGYRTETTYNPTVTYTTTEGDVVSDVSLGTYVAGMTAGKTVKIAYNPNDFTDIRYAEKNANIFGFLPLLFSGFGIVIIIITISNISKAKKYIQSCLNPKQTEKKDYFND